MSNSNRGGARPGAGRPKIKVVKAPERPDSEWMLVPIPIPMWEEFCEAAQEYVTPLGNEPQKSDYVRLADLVMIDAINRYINQKKRADKRKAKENEQI